MIIQMDNTDGSSHHDLRYPLGSKENPASIREAFRLISEETSRIRRERSNPSTNQEESK